MTDVGMAVMTIGEVAELALSLGVRTSDLLETVLGRVDNGLRGGLD